jgi:hypothetical protein
MQKGGEGIQCNMADGSSTGCSIKPNSTSTTSRASSGKRTSKPWNDYSPHTKISRNSRGRNLVCPFPSSPLSSSARRQAPGFEGLSW